MNKYITMALLAFAALIQTGCRSMSQPYSASFASVEFMVGYTAEQIRDVAVAVFREDGFTVSSPQPMHLVCNREGTRMNKVAYGDWIGGSSVAERVKLEFVYLSEKKYRLQCNAYMVRDPGGLEDEVKLANIRSRPYQDLLNKVAARLK